MNERQAIKDFTDFVRDMEPELRPSDAVLFLTALADYVEFEVRENGEALVPFFGVFKRKQGTNEMDFVQGPDFELDE